MGDVARSRSRRSGAISDSEIIFTRSDNTVVRGAGTRICIRFLTDHFNVMAHMGAQVNSAAGDFESLSSAVLRQGVIAMGAA